MHWIVQNNMYNEEAFGDLITALERNKVSYSLHKVIPFSHELDPEPFGPIICPSEPVIVMGTYALSRIAQERGWKPGAFINNNLAFTSQLMFNWGRSLLNRDASIGPLDKIPYITKPCFIRPVLDSKSFAGCVMDWEQLSEWKSRILALSPEDGSTITGDTMVMISPVKSILKEYRLWIINQKVVTGSVYKINNKKHYELLTEPEVIEFAEKMANKWSPIEAYVMDVALTYNGLKIIEVNNINSSGFYAGDMTKLVRALEDAFSTTVY